MLEKGIVMVSHVNRWYSRKIHSFKNWLSTQNGLVLIVSQILYIILLYQGLMEGRGKT